MNTFCLKKIDEKFLNHEDEICKYLFQYTERVPHTRGSGSDRIDHCYCLLIKQYVGDIEMCNHKEI